MRISRPPFTRTLALLVTALFLATTGTVLANLPGGGTNGPGVTLTDNGTTVTMNNGIVSIVVTKADASIHTFNYSYNNGGGAQNPNLLSGGNNGGQLYWTGNPASFGNMNFTYSVVTSSTNYIEIALTSNTATNGIVFKCDAASCAVHLRHSMGTPGAAGSF